MGERGGGSAFILCYGRASQNTHTRPYRKLRNTEKCWGLTPVSASPQVPLRYAQQLRCVCARPRWLCPMRCCTHITGPWRHWRGWCEITSDARSGTRRHARPLLQLTPGHDLFLLRLLRLVKYIGLLLCWLGKPINSDGYSVSASLFCVTPRQ